MNRPRPSVLQLFDPLSTRDAHSPESDKENTLPDSDFFPHVKHPSPVRLTRRLVEVGDVTVDFHDLGDEDDVDEEDDNEGEDEGEDDTIGPGLPPSPRTPLGDVTFDRELTPMRSKMYRRKPPASEVVVSNSSPDDYAFASVINEVSASGATFGGSHAAPAVVVCSPDASPSSSNGDAADTLSTSLATLSLATPTGSLIADTTLVFPTPSEASTSLLVPTTQPLQLSMPSFNPDRSSADLHSSFALHMDMTSAESSFDLLNDKISFLDHGDEESYYLEGGLVLISQENSKENGTSSTESGIHTELSPVIAPAGPPSPSGPPSPPLPEIPQETLNTAGPSISPTIPLQPLTMPSVAPVFVAPPAKQTTPALSTSLPEPPTLVPALKIVKRQRPDAATGSETAVGTYDGAQSANPPVSVPGRATRIASSIVVRYGTEGQGPMRVPISSSDKDKSATTTKYHKPTPGTTLSGPRRVPAPTQAPPPPPPPAKIPSQLVQATSGLGLKRPLRVVPPNGSASASSLPRAVGGTNNASGVSRLPMPSKSKIGTISGTGIARRKIL
ncbi:hypothetical protein B0H17DRAFT_1081135 [Mycena rosella]|uniref:Uncharacterized protein n=1 Tax=Mycena rosella TaxID=1033263 RepID=A0AAD7D2B1_MYCRO|nr:hypothetical protein B0H17DRAFT_1081135 [Mycena rosella]